MSAEDQGHGLKVRLAEIRKKYSREEAIAAISALLKEEYKKLEDAAKEARSSYLSMNVDDPAQQNDVADLRLAAVEAYQPAYMIENFLADMGFGIVPLLPHYEGSFELSSFNDDEWLLSVVGLKENAMRTLGGHCNVIGDIIVLERLLYDHMYMAAVLKLTDDYEPGKQSYVEFDYYTVVFDEDIQSIVKVPLDAR